MSQSQNVARASLIILLLIGGLVGRVSAQGGGKAEPLRVEFKRGANSITLSGKVRDRQEAEYVFAARKGQELNIKLSSSPRRSSVFDLRAPDNADLGLEFDANWNYSGTLPKSGDYTINVLRPTADPGTSSYRLTLTIH